MRWFVTKSLAAAAVAIVAVSLWICNRPEVESTASSRRTESASLNNSSSAGDVNEERLAPLAESLSSQRFGGAASSPETYKRGSVLPVPSPKFEAPGEMLSRVQNALSNGSPKDALQAATTLGMCAAVLKAAEYEAHAGITGMSPEQSRQMLSDKEKRIFDSMKIDTTSLSEGASSFDRTFRQCQALDAQTLSKQGDLLARAFEGGAPDSAAPYLSWLRHEDSGKNANPSLMNQLRTEVERAAEDGQILTLQRFVFGTQAMSLEDGFTAVQHEAYRNAYLRIIGEADPNGAASLARLSVGMGQLALSRIELTEQEKQQASLLTDKILANFHNKRKG